MLLSLFGALIFITSAQLQGSLRTVARPSARHGEEFGLRRLLFIKKQNGGGASLPLHPHIRVVFSMATLKSRTNKGPSGPVTHLLEKGETKKCSYACFACLVSSLRSSTDQNCKQFCSLSCVRLFVGVAKQHWRGFAPLLNTLLIPRSSGFVECCALYCMVATLQASSLRSSAAQKFRSSTSARCIALFVVARVDGVRSSPHQHERGPSARP